MLLHRLIQRVLITKAQIYHRDDRIGRVLMAGLAKPGYPACQPPDVLASAGMRRGAGRRTAAAAFVMLTVVGFTRTADAEVFASDDFSSDTSGTGWAVGDTWDGAVADGVLNSAIDNEVHRAFETPLSPNESDKFYIAVDFQIPEGNSWGGLAHMEGTEGSGAETFWIGDPSQYDAYGLDLKQNDTLPINDGNPPTGGIVTDQDFHRLIAEIDFDDSSPDVKYSLWIDSFDPNNPNYTTVISNSPILQPWQSVSIWIDNADGRSMQIDNLIYTDEPGLVFLDPVLDGDYNRDGTVDAADYVTWRNEDGTQPRYELWRANFGKSAGSGAGSSLIPAVSPEPATPGLALLGAAIMVWARRIRR
jgi:hypothetical protein